MTRKSILDDDFGLDKAFEELGHAVAPNERALTGDIGDEILDTALGRPHPKRLAAPKNTSKKKGLFDL